MKKIKLNLVSGNVIEKPLMNAFTSNNMSYVVLDNEMNGSMGLPIILVSKLENNKLIKIIDQAEWQSVKEYLKSIIAGGSMEYIKMPDEISADDIYYTQLTLPVPSFDALKNAYKVENVQELPKEEEEATIMDINPANIGGMGDTQMDVPTVNIAPEVSNISPNVEIANNVSSPMPSVEVAPISASDIQSSNEEINNPLNYINQSVEPIPNVSVEPVSSPVNEVKPEIPIVNISNTVETPMTPAEPEITPTPVIDSPVTNDIFKEQKEAFMQACENMFDALVQKFEKELENHKN